MLAAALAVLLVAAASSCYVLLFSRILRKPAAASAAAAAGNSTSDEDGQLSEEEEEEVFRTIARGGRTRPEDRWKVFFFLKRLFRFFFSSDFSDSQSCWLWVLCDLLGLST